MRILRKNKRLMMPICSRGGGGRPLKRLKSLAQEYPASKPGADSLSGNLSLDGCLKRALGEAVYEQYASGVIAGLTTQRAVMQTETGILQLKLEINTTPIVIRRSYAKPLQYLTLALTARLSSWQSFEA
ncbi:unnamed protein product [Penicillium pancosmium]